ncbi:hypothetical protein BDK51DRAFT_49901 [Blyttiomyces helicus]|uniref:NUDE domain-containing protein n=1 Tax=Blyttiomyces helicus TaxID=388810 RepID=A0A4P9WCT8_9FUNG|nr:hypothetical protein BDK51DRAFT_49901 [Blyttiomyces helicus]|eukprot:RKO89485.1 hypothetical protein BDK51DRAFT_49901 [Blyttiomyces helicus]
MPDDLEHYRALSVQLAEDLETARREFDELQTDSRDVEDELEKSVAELTRANARLKAELDDLKVRACVYGLESRSARGVVATGWVAKTRRPVLCPPILASFRSHFSSPSRPQLKHLTLQTESNNSIIVLHDEIHQLRLSQSVQKERIRELEIVNNSLEQTCRVQTVSFEDSEMRYSKLLERTALLEQEIVGKIQVEEEAQRLRDDLRDMSSEVSVLRNSRNPVNEARWSPTQSRRPSATPSSISADTSEARDALPGQAWEPAASAMRESAMVNLQELLARAKALEGRITHAREKFVAPLLTGPVGGSGRVRARSMSLSGSGAL